MRKGRLPKPEAWFYFGSWIFGIIYSAYHVYLIGNKFSYAFQHNLVAGWSFLNRKKDNADEEWRLWTTFILNVLSVWIVIHYIGACIINSLNPKILSLWYVVLTASCVTYNYGVNIVMAFFIQPVIFVAILCISRSRIFVWLCSYFVCNMFIHEDVVSYYSLESEDDFKLLIPVLMWIYLRCISFCLDEIDKKLSWRTVYHFFGYVFYLPCFFLGPILLYHEFANQLNKKQRKFRWKTQLYLLMNNVRYLFWLFITEFILHFVYISCLLHYIKALTAVKYHNVWIMYGVGFCMGQFFFLKYTVVYGLALTWTAAEGYVTPKPPRCIARICLYSDMWRHFDEGLYFFIRRYIYDPYLGFSSAPVSKKILFTFLCFLFVFIWHGMYYPVLMWSLLNFCGIIVETTARSVSKTKYYIRFKNAIGLDNEQRFVGFICAPLTIVSAISNFYFLGGTVVAETYFSYIFKHGTLSNTLCLWFFVYCLCQVSMQLKSSKPARQR